MPFTTMNLLYMCTCVYVHVLHVYYLAHMHTIKLYVYDMKPPHECMFDIQII